MQKGSEIIVQVTKDGIGTKGPTLTTYLSLPGRYLVLMPGLDRRGVSRKIDDGKERDRLKKVLDQLEVREHLGFIVRTAGVGQSRAELQKDYRYLTKLWDRVEEAAESAKAPNLLYRESDLVIRTIRDIYTPDMGDIIVDNEDVARRAREFLATVMPKAVKNVKLYVGERPLFTAYGVEDEIGKLFLHRVELKSGGSLVILESRQLIVSYPAAWATLFERTGHGIESNDPALNLADSAIHRTDECAVEFGPDEPDRKDHLEPARRQERTASPGVMARTTRFKLRDGLAIEIDQLKDGSVPSRITASVPSTMRIFRPASSVTSFAKFGRDCPFCVSTWSLNSVGDSSITIGR